MNSRQALPAVSLIVFSCSFQANGNCLCGNAGTDVCNSSPLIVRPLPLPRPRPAAPAFVPLGDRCSCGTSVVRPAVPPQPTCSACSPPASPPPAPPTCDSWSPLPPPTPICSSAPSPAPCAGCQICLRNPCRNGLCLRVPPFVGNLISRLQNNFALPNAAIVS